MAAGSGSAAPGCGLTGEGARATPGTCSRVERRGSDAATGQEERAVHRRAESRRGARAGGVRHPGGRRGPRERGRPVPGGRARDAREGDVPDQQRARIPVRGHRVGAGRPARAASHGGREPQPLRHAVHRDRGRAGGHHHGRERARSGAHDPDPGGRRRPAAGPGPPGARDAPAGAAGGHAGARRSQRGRR